MRARGSKPEDRRAPRPARAPTPRYSAAFFEVGLNRPERISRGPLVACSVARRIASSTARVCRDGGACTSGDVFSDKGCAFRIHFQMIPHVDQRLIDRPQLGATGRPAADVPFRNIMTSRSHPLCHPGDGKLRRLNFEIVEPDSVTGFAPIRNLACVSGRGKRGFYRERLCVRHMSRKPAQQFASSRKW